MKNTYARKHISTVLVSVLSATVSLSVMAEGSPSKGKWDVGVAGGWGMTQTSETLIQNTYSVPPSRDGYKYKLKQSGPVGGLTAGYTLQQNKNTFGLALGAYKDFYTARNSGDKKDFISGYENNFAKDFKRKYTLEIAGKIGRNLKEDLNVYVKLGGLYSQFREQYRATNETPIIDIRKNLAGWGGVAGVGLQRSYESFNLGAEYNYHYYERMGSTMHFGASRIPAKNQSKIRPQYHQVFLKISKSF